MMIKQDIQNKIEVNIKEEWCKGCTICVEFCPHDVLAMDGAVAKVVNPEACTACMLCELYCPDFAITVEDKRPARKQKV